MESNKFLLDKAGEKGRFCELSTNEITEKKKKKTENAIPAVTKKPQTLVWNYLTVLQNLLTNLKKP